VTRRRILTHEGKYHGADSGSVCIVFYSTTEQATRTARQGWRTCLRFGSRVWRWELKVLGRRQIVFEAHVVEWGESIAEATMRTCMV
jgi:hypothetical protein